MQLLTGVLSGETFPYTTTVPGGAGSDPPFCVSSAHEEVGVPPSRLQDFPRCWLHHREGSCTRLYYGPSEGRATSHPMGKWDRSCPYRWHSPWFYR